MTAKRKISEIISTVFRASGAKTNAAIANGKANARTQIEVVPERARRVRRVFVDGVEHLVLDLRDGVAVEDLDLVLLVPELDVGVRHVQFLQKEKKSRSFAIRMGLNYSWNRRGSQNKCNTTFPDQSANIGFVTRFKPPCVQETTAKS